MKKLLTFVFVGFVFPLIVSAKSLPNYEDIIKAAQEGSSITAFIDFSKCNPAFPMRAYYSPKSMILINDYVVFSENHFTLNNPQFSGKPVREYVHYKLNNDGQLNIKTAILDPIDFKQKGQEPEVNCFLQKGAFFYTN